MGGGETVASGMVPPGVAAAARGAGPATAGRGRVWHHPWDKDSGGAAAWQDGGGRAPVRVTAAAAGRRRDLARGRAGFRGCFLVFGFEILQQFPVMPDDVLVEPFLAHGQEEGDGFVGIVGALHLRIEARDDLVAHTVVDGLVRLVVPEANGKHVFLFILEVFQDVCLQVLDCFSGGPSGVAAHTYHLVQPVDDAEDFLVGVVDAFYADFIAFVPFQHGVLGAACGRKKRKKEAAFFPYHGGKRTVKRGCGRAGVRRSAGRHQIWRATGPGWCRR